MLYPRERRTTKNGQVCHVGWKDQAFVLIISSAFSREEHVLGRRKRPEETSSKAYTSQVPFGNKATKELLIPLIADCYNYNMGSVNEFDHLIA
jgi:hypothetical protein